MKQREIALISYPFSDRSFSKVRPVVVISNDNYNKKTKDCIVLAMTSVIKDEPHSIFITQKDIGAGKLIRPSRIRVDKILSISQELIIKKVGIVNESILKKIKSELLDLV